MIKIQKKNFNLEKEIEKIKIKHTSNELEKTYFIK